MQSLATLLALVAALISITLTNAHPGHALENLSAEEQQAHTKRALSAVKCAPQAQAMREMRKLARRGMKKGHDKPDVINIPEYAHKLQNATCVLAPESAAGPYYVRNEFVRHDLRENQVGVNLVLDIGVLDINTCKPLSKAFVELWSANSAGKYSGFTTLVAPPIPDNTSANSSPQENRTDNLSWLRGGMATTPEGIVELTTIYPAWYAGRTVHVHTMVHTNYTVQKNGTIVSGKGSLVHTGQIYFDDDLNSQVGGSDSYNTSAQIRITNAEDISFSADNTAGYNSVADYTLLGDRVEDGILAYITIGVDTSASYQIASNSVQSK